MPNRPFDTDAYNLGEVWANRIFGVPRMQRPYTWKIDKAGKLWEDLINFHSERNNEGHYFLGNTIVFEENGTIMLVDGQQRIATLTIIFAVIRDRIQQLIDGNENADFEVEHHSFGNCSAVFYRDVINADFISGRTGRHVIPKVNLREIDGVRLQWIQKTIQQRIDAYGFDNKRGGGKVPSRTNSGGKQRVYHNYWELMKLLKTQLSDEVVLTGGRFGLQEWDKEAQLEWLIDFYTTLTDHVWLSITVVPDISQAFTIFKTINDRGEPLSIYDVMRATVLGRVEGVTTDQTTKDTILAHMDSLRGIDQDEIHTYIRRWYISREGVKFTPSKLADKIQNEVSNLENVREITSYSQSISSEVDNYLLIRKQGDITGSSGQTDLLPAWDSIQGLQICGLKQHIPLLMSMLYKNWHIEQQIGFNNIVSTIESLYVRYYKAIQGSPSTPETLFAEWAGYCRQTGTSPEDLLERIYEDSRNKLLPNYTDSDFTEDFTNLQDISNNLAWYLLKKYESYLRGEDAFARENYPIAGRNVLQVEHILPQNPSSDWDGIFARGEERDQYTYKLGNMTLLWRPVNNRARNKIFSEKT